jgi:transcriptional regulator with XRE-family HTH domain
VTSDVHVGLRIRQRRQLLSLSISQLAARIGVDPQQVLKYETGTVRIAAIRLYEISQALDIYLDWFFTSDETASPKIKSGAQDFLALTEQFAKIKDPTARERVISFAKEIAVDQHLIEQRQQNKALN